jgi:single-strand DNA-binding protein
MSINNQITLIGNLGADFETKDLGNGRLLAKSSLATNETYRNAQDELVQKTEWHRLVVWGKRAEFISKLAKKGTQLAITGKLKYNSYEDSEGVKKTSAQIEVSEFRLLEPKSKEQVAV